MKPLARIVLAIVLLGTLSLRTLPDIANTYVVTTILDTDVDGCGVPPADECSLREALNAANGHSGTRAFATSSHSAFSAAASSYCGH